MGGVLILIIVDNVIVDNGHVLALRKEDDYDAVES